MQVQKLFAAANKTFRICILKNLCILRPTVANYSTNIDSIPDRISPAERGAFRKQEIDNERAHDHSEPAYENALPFHRIPGPGGPPYFGTYFHYRKDPETIANMKYHDIQRYNKYGPIVKETLLGETVIHLYDPNFIRIVYQNEDKMPIVPPLLETIKMYREMRDLSPGLGNTNGETWYRLRSAVQQMMMRPKAVTVYLPFVNQVANDFIARVQEVRNDKGEVPDFKLEVSKWALESASLTCFERRLCCLDQDENSIPVKLIRINDKIFKISTKLKYSVPFYKYFNTKTMKTLVGIEDFFYQEVQKLIATTVDDIQSLIDKGQLQDGQYNFLTYLLDKPNLDFKDVSIITQSLFADTLSTTAPAIIYNLYCLARNPDAQQKLYQEVKQIVGDEKEVTTDMIKQMPYLKACVREAFRLFPIGNAVQRITKKNMVIGGFQIPEGTHLHLNQIVMITSPDYFEEPNKFLPERWIRGSSPHNIHPYVLTPFSVGVRMCAGRRFAEQELWVLVTKFVQRFELHWHYEDMDQTYQLLFVPNKLARFSFKDRRA